MLKPQKAKTLHKDKIKDLTGLFKYSIKYDGHQIFIVKRGASVKFYTSNWKQFNIEPLRVHLSTLEADFILIGEYLYGCEGKLGDRAFSSMLTTFRTNYNKGLHNDIIDELQTKVKVFDCIPIVMGIDCYEYTFDNRRLFLEKLKLPKGLEVVAVQEGTLDIIELNALTVVKEGWEGLMAIRGDSQYLIGKRVHHAFKVKPRLTADLLCIGVNPGLGKYVGLIGSLRCRDSKGLEVDVGSGLSDDYRNKSKDTFIGKVIEVEYERIDDTYIQPVFKYIRLDKTKLEID